MTIPTDAQPGTITYRANYYENDGKVTFSYDEYEVVKVTPKGAWVAEKGNLRMSEFSQLFLDKDLREEPDKTWYPFTCRFVGATKEEALEHLKYRKIRHRMHIQRRLLRIENVLQALGVEVKFPLDPFDSVGGLKGVRRLELYDGRD